MMDEQPGVYMITSNPSAADKRRIAESDYFDRRSYGETPDPAAAAIIARLDQIIALLERLPIPVEPNHCF